MSEVVMDVISVDDTLSAKLCEKADAVSDSAIFIDASLCAGAIFGALRDARELCMNDAGELCLKLLDAEVSPDDPDSLAVRFCGRRILEGMARMELLFELIRQRLDITDEEYNAFMHSEYLNLVEMLDAYGVVEHWEDDDDAGCME